jgi:hypothetical protein
VLAWPRSDRMSRRYGRESNAGPRERYKSVTKRAPDCIAR